MVLNAFKREFEVETRKYVLFVLFIAVVLCLGGNICSIMLFHKCLISWIGKEVRRASLLKS